ncbi:YihY/virulence factor BrkB family protein [Streptococcus pneumoniae]
MKKIRQWVEDNTFIQAFLTFYRSSDSDVTSIAVAYYFLISIFPLLLIVTNILPYFHIPMEDFLGTLQQILPDSIYEVVASTVKKVLTQPSNSLLSFSVISALWTFSQSMTFLQKAFNKAYGIVKGRGMVWQRLLSVLVSIALQVLLVLSLGLTLFGRMLLNVVHGIFPFNDQIYQSLQSMTQPTMYLLLFLSLTMLYYFLPDVAIPKIRYVLPGTVFSMTILFAILNLFSTYLENYISHFLDVRVVGSVLVIGLMVWFILLSKILIYGAILNASYQSCKEENIKAKEVGKHRLFAKDGKGE